MSGSPATTPAVNRLDVRPDEPSTANEGGTRLLEPIRRVLLALEGIMSVSGLAGGVYMATHPTTVMSLKYLQGTWFHTWRWPGIALFFFVGVCPALVVVATYRRFRVEHIGHICVGLGLMAWVLLEAAWVVVSPGLQIAVGAMGVAILILGISRFRARTLGTRPCVAGLPTMERDEPNSTLGSSVS